MADLPAPENMESEATEPEGRMPLTEHLRELRDRLIKAGIGFALAFVVCYYYSDPLFALLQQPLITAMAKVAPDQATLAVTSLTEGFLTNLKVGALGAFFLASPVFFYQGWQFIAPGLYPTERKLVIPFVMAFSILFTAGAGFGYFVVFPFVFTFFLQAIGGGILPVLSIKDFLEIASKLLLLFGLIFQLPVLSFFLARLGIINWQTMKAYRKYAIVVIFVLGAVLTPPDPISQALIAIPFMILYEVGIWVARLAAPRQVEAETADS